jgi:hypothetical protein
MVEPGEFITRVHYDITLGGIQKRAARSDDSEFPPETSKVLTTGLQPQTNFLLSTCRANSSESLSLLCSEAIRAAMFKDRQQSPAEVKKVTIHIIEK